MSTIRTFNVEARLSTKTQTGYSDYKAYQERKAERSERAKRAAATRAWRKKLMDDLITEAVRRSGPVTLPYWATREAFDKRQDVLASKEDTSVSCKTGLKP
jgi:hypothetical protein